jgi:hypothetical protein
LGLLSLATCALAGGAETGTEPEATAKKPVGVVKLDIVEKLEGKPSKDAPATYLIRKRLREFGFVAYTEKPLRVDEYEKKKREKEQASKPVETGLTATAIPEAAEERPAPDLVIKGNIEVAHLRNSTFYGANIAFMFLGAGSLSILDPTGKELCVIDDREEWGQDKEAQAREETLKRISAWLAADVIKAEPVLSRLGPKSREAALKYVEGVEQKRASTAKKEEGGGKKP